MHVHVYVCMYVCMYVCVYVCMYVCMYVFLFPESTKEFPESIISTGVEFCEISGFQYRVCKAILKDPFENVLST